MDNQIQNSIVSFIWGIADDCLRDVYVRGKYRDVILPMTVIRRLDAMLEDTKTDVLKMKDTMDKAGITNQWPALCNAADQAFCNASPFLLKDLTSRAKKQTLKADFEAYLDGFSPNVQEILEKFKFRNQIDTMIDADILGAVIEKFVSPTINLSPKPVYTDDTMTTIKLLALDNHGMGTIFEELIRKFNEENNEEAGEHWTPRDVVELMADLIIVPVADQIMDATYSCYDGACGTGGMLTVAQDRLLNIAKRRGKNVSIHLFGQEVQPETYAICKADISNTELVNVVNRYIDHDGYKLVVSDTIGDKNFYKCISTRIGVQGEVKNIIFAAKYKPEIVFDDALNNDIRITKNENQCLIYNRPIPPTGVMWNDLVDWYAEEKNIDENREIVFIKRLCECLDTSFKAQGAKSGPETWMLQAYYNLKKELGKDLPALIPQVYLYYDPQTLKQRGYKLFEHQKMDFLMVFSHKDRVVIEIDGRQHYAEGNSASPRLYSEMVRAQREMTLFGYDVYRFGGYEFVGADSDEKKKEAVLDDLKQFFLRLFSKYSAL